MTRTYKLSLTHDVLSYGLEERASLLKDASNIVVDLWYSLKNNPTL